MMLDNINWITLLASPVAAMAIGFLWYSPILFGKEWTELMKLKKGDIDQSKKGMAKTYGISFIAALITAFVLKQFIDLFYVTTVMEGLQLAFWAWFGFVATTMVTGVLYEKKSWSLFLINSGYQLASLLAMSAILTYWM